MLEITSNDNQDIEDVDRNLLEKNTCRYCFDDIDKNFSSCLCQSTLCKNCLEQELIMTSERSGKQLKCTICKQEYKIKKNKKAKKSVDTSPKKNKKSLPEYGLNLSQKNLHGQP